MPTCLPEFELKRKNVSHYVKACNMMYDERELSNCHIVRFPSKIMFFNLKCFPEQSV